MTADALASYVAWTSAAILLAMQDKQALVFHKEGYQPPVPTVIESIETQIYFHVSENKLTTTRVKDRNNSWFCLVQEKKVKYWRYVMTVAVTHWKINDMSCIY